MSEPYEEVIAGEYWLRLPPGERHELICERLHVEVAASLAGVGGLRRLTPRTLVRLKADATLRPDLALVDADTGALWLVAEVISSGDHRPDTVLKKQLYEDGNVARLWMIDPRYDNVEVYERTELGLVLSRILALNDVLNDDRMPLLQLGVADLFGP